jgi:hypothetical protein
MKDCYREHSHKTGQHKRWIKLREGNRQLRMLRKDCDGVSPFKDKAVTDTGQVRCFITEQHENA